MLFALLGGQLAEVCQRTSELISFHMIEGPHLITIEVQVRLRHQGLAIFSDEAQIFYHVSQIPLVIEGLPLPMPAESAHGRCRPPIVLAGECYLVSPPALLGAVGVKVAVYFVDAELVTHYAGDHAAPAEMRIDVTRISENDRFTTRFAYLPVILPVGTKFVVPARILRLEPFKIAFVRWIDSPEVNRPTHGEELGDLMVVVIFHDTVPSRLNIVVMNLDAVLFEREQVSSVVVIKNPALPEFSIGFAILIPIFGAVLDESSDSGVDDGVVLPKRVPDISLQEVVVLGVVDDRHQHRVAVTDVARLVGLHTQEYHG